MSIEKIANDLAKKAYVSRSLGGVIKAGQYAAWAEEYRDLAQDHYVKIGSEKRAAIDPLIYSTLVGGGLGAGVGALGSLGSDYISGKENKHKLRDALTYGLLGGAGGAGLGAMKQLYSDPNAIDRTITAVQGLPEKDYPSSALEALGKEINSRALSNNSLEEAAVKSLVPTVAGAIGGQAAGRYAGGQIARGGKINHSLNNSPISGLPRNSYVSEAKPSRDLSKYKGVGGKWGRLLGGLGGLASGVGWSLSGSKSDKEIGGILNNVITANLNNPGLASNPQHLQLLQDLSAETAKGVTQARGNDILETMQKLFKD